jgi:uncharacterized protein YcbX
MSMPITILTPQGFLFDRQWRITYGDANESGEFDTLTQRDCPRMALIQTEMRGRDVVLSLPGDEEPLAVPLLHKFLGENKIVQLSDVHHGFDEGDYVANWLTARLGVSCRLVRVLPSYPSFKLGLTEKQSKADQLFTGFPVLIISSASLADLNSRLRAPVNMNRFRPNMTIEGGEAFQEENWKRIRIGNMILRAQDRCGRCSLIQVDQELGVMASKEPLKVLNKYRRFDNEPIFGQYFAPEKNGTLVTGTAVEVLE